MLGQKNWSSESPATALVVQADEDEQDAAADQKNASLGHMLESRGDDGFDACATPREDGEKGAVVNRLSNTEPQGMTWDAAPSAEVEDDPDFYDDDLSGADYWGRVAHVVAAATPMPSVEGGARGCEASEAFASPTDGGDSVTFSCVPQPSTATFPSDDPTVDYTTDADKVTEDYCFSLLHPKENGIVQLVSTAVPSLGFLDTTAGEAQRQRRRSERRQRFERRYRKDTDITTTRRREGAFNSATGGPNAHGALAILSDDERSFIEVTSPNASYVFSGPLEAQLHAENA